MELMIKVREGDFVVVDGKDFKIAGIEFDDREYAPPTSPSIKLVDLDGDEVINLHLPNVPALTSESRVRQLRTFLGG